MTAPALVAHEPRAALAPRYRVLHGPSAGDEVSAAEVHICTGACHGTGRCFGQPNRPECRSCRGSGRLLGAKPNQTWPVAVELIEEA